MGDLPSELINQLEVGVGICDINSLRFMGGNPTLLGLIDNLLEFSNTESGSIEKHIKSLELEDIIDAHVSHYVEKAETKGIDFMYEKTALPVWIETDATMLNQILSSLLDNAIKFTRRGKVQLRIARYAEDPRQLLFSVTDTGVGIEQSYMDSVFLPFSQEESDVNREYDGTGLSLSISKRYVESLEGQMWCESQKGKGSTFYFSLPFTFAEG